MDDVFGKQVITWIHGIRQLHDGNAEARHKPGRVLHKHCTGRTQAQ